MLAVAALSARSLVEAAAKDGWPVAALDLFGDVDTCRAAAQWLPIGEASALRIDGERLLVALDVLARRGDVDAWIAGSGFEAHDDLLEQGAARLPLLGTAPADQRRVRDPATFFGVLRDLGLAHPQTRFTPPDSPAGWLLKNAAGSGGAQVRRADADAPMPGDYWQRERLGLPMSVTYIANGRDAVLLGFNRQWVRPAGSCPFVFCGIAGPVPVADALRRQLNAAARGLAETFRLRGLGSIDFVADGDRAELLEVNPRPPASTALYPRVDGAGVLQAHRRACCEGALPQRPEADGTLRGSEIVFARTPLTLDEQGAALIAAWPGARDLPRAGSRFAPGDPLCSLSACGDDAAALPALLAWRRDKLLERLETSP